MDAHDIDSLGGVTFPLALMELDLQYSRIKYLQGEALKRLKARLTEIVDFSVDMHRNLVELERMRL